MTAASFGLDKSKKCTYDRKIKGVEKEEYICGAVREKCSWAERHFQRVQMEGSF